MEDYLLIQMLNKQIKQSLMCNLRIHKSTLIKDLQLSLILKNKKILPFSNNSNQNKLKKQHKKHKSSLSHKIKKLKNLILHKDKLISLEIQMQ